MLDSAPSLPVAFREADLDLQLRTFGGWMRPQDVEQLPPAARALATSAKPPQVGFLRRQQLLGTWSAMTKNARAAGDALSLARPDRDERLAQLEAAPGDSALAIPWRQLLRQHEERLALLRLLRLAADLDTTRATAGAWARPGAVEAAEVDVVEADGTLSLTLRGTSHLLVLHPDVAPRAE